MRFAIALPVLILIGCTNNKVPPGGAERPEEMIMRSIVTLNSSATELSSPYRFYARIVGRSFDSDYPADALEAPVVTFGENPNWEAIEEINPDLIIYNADKYSDEEEERLEQIAKKATFGFDADTLVGFKKELLKLGALTEAATDASLYVDQISSASATARAAVGDNRPTVAVLQSAEGGYVWMGEGSLLASIIAASGGEPVGAEGDQFAGLDAAALAASDPDIILTPGESSAILTDPQFASLTAVKNDQVYHVERVYLLRTGSHVDDLIMELGNAFSASKR